MPKQEVFFETQSGAERIEVLKTYDQAYAREAFDAMDEDAQNVLWETLEIEEKYDPTDIPPLDDPDIGDFLWEQVVDAAREDGSVLSFFVVNETKEGRSESLYVSPDWPSAEAFAKERITARSTD